MQVLWNCVSVLTDYAQKEDWTLLLHSTEFQFDSLAINYSIILGPGMAWLKDAAQLNQ